MQIEGGYIVIGADDYGRPTDQVNERHVELFEQADFRAKVRKHLSEPLELRARHHRIDGHDNILIYVAENPDGFAVVNALGNNSKGKAVFRPGDVFARHGPASERWNQHDFAKIKRKIASGPARALTWQLDNDTFLERVMNFAEGLSVGEPLLHRDCGTDANDSFPTSPGAMSGGSGRFIWAALMASAPSSSSAAPLQVHNRL